MKKKCHPNVCTHCCLKSEETNVQAGFWTAAVLFPKGVWQFTVAYKLFTHVCNGGKNVTANGALIIPWKKDAQKHVFERFRDTQINHPKKWLMLIFYFILIDKTYYIHRLVSYIMITITKATTIITFKGNWSTDSPNLWHWLASLCRAYISCFGQM